MRHLAIALLLILAAQAHAQTDPLPIQSVSTWEQLLKQPAIDLGDGVKVRLGIESLECPQWSGVALYAYTEGFDDIVAREVNRDTLGPVWVSVRHGDTSFDCKETYDSLPRWRWEIGDKQPRLFFRFLMVDKVGDYNVTVRTEKKKDIAQVTFKGTKSAFHPWSPLLLTKNEEYEQLGDAIKYQRTTPAKATYEGKGIALPNMRSSIGYSAEGWHPKWQKHLRDQGEKPEPLAFPFGKGNLPKVLPQDVDPELKINFSQEKMLIHIPVRGEIYHPRPDWQFLCRWWVNGKPFVPDQVDPIPTMKGGSTRYATEEKDLQIELKITPKDLKAKSGDEIKLQLLHCPSGWLTVRNPQGSEKAGRGFPRLSNKVSFKLP